MKTTDNLVIIPARKNSKRIKDKNLLKLGKKNLVEITIDFALKISDKNSIYLSESAISLPSGVNMEKKDIIRAANSLKYSIESLVE